MSFETLKCEAATGSASAMNLLAIYLAFGLHGFKKNFELALDWIKKAAALHNEIALNNLGLIYLNGWLGCDQDVFKGNYWIKQALSVSNQHFRDALNLHHKKRYSEAMPLFELAVTKFQCAGSMYQLAKYMGGEHAPVNAEKSRRYYNCAAQLGCLLANFVIRGEEWTLKISKKDACGGCGKWAVNVCSGCKSQKYCSLQCQLQAWPNHKSDCAASIFEMD
jgi:TPR repeat protein